MNAATRSDGIFIPTVLTPESATSRCADATSMSKYRTEPVEVDALLFTGGEESARPILSWVEALDFKGHLYPELEAGVLLKENPRGLHLPEQIRVQAGMRYITIPVDHYLYLTANGDLRVMQKISFEEKFKKV